MKKLLIIILLYPLVSFENIKTKYWQGIVIVKTKGADITYAKVIEATDEKKASKLFVSNIKGNKNLSGGSFVLTNPDSYVIFEITKEDILK